MFGNVYSLRERKEDNSFLYDCWNFFDVTILGEMIRFEGEDWKRIRVLGKGSFGEAHLVSRCSDGRHAVCKMVNLLTMNEKERKEAENEVAVLRRLKHPNVVEYIGSANHNGTLQIMMEFCNAGDLEQLIRKQKGVHFSEEVIARIFVQMAQAVRYLHERRILHRDLKAQNVFLMQKDAGGPLIVKLGDFGISTVLRNTLALAKTVCGTPYYFSPELCMNKPYNNKSDIWSMGCILYELCTLKHAFDASSMKALMQRILKGTFDPIPKQYSPSLMALITAMLQQRAEKRMCIQQVLSHSWVTQCADNMQAEYQAKKEVEAEKLSLKLRPHRNESSPDRFLRHDQRQRDAMHRRNAQEKDLVEKKIALENERRMRNAIRRPIDKALPARRGDIEDFNDIKRRAEICSYEEQQPYLDAGRKIAEDLRRKEEERERAAAEREKHLNSLMEQMAAIDHKLQSRKRRLAGEAKRVPWDIEATPAQLAKAYKNRVSEDAPWNRDREIPVGFTKESWEKHKEIMCGRGGGVPQKTSSVEPTIPVHTVLPDTVHKGKRSVKPIDVDAILKAEDGPIENDEITVAQNRANELWQQQKARIRMAQGLPVDTSGITEAEMKWLIHKQKIEQARNENVLVSASPALSGDAPAEEEAEEVEEAEEDEIAYDEYSCVIEAMKRPTGVGDPPEFFEEADLPKNDLSRMQTMAKFTLDGRTLNLDGAAPDDPLPLRIAALREFLVHSLGGERSFSAMYSALEDIQRADISDDAANVLLEKLEAQNGPNARFVDLMIQLMVCEGLL